MKELQKQVNDWQRKTFGKSDPVTYFNKLDVEVTELYWAIFYTDKTKTECADEIADCMICLLGLAGAIKINAESAVKKKLQILKKRKWKRQEDGTFQHL